MSSAERLAAIFAALTVRELPCLVLGGHAVRYYGIDRNTVDYDLHVALEPRTWQRLPELLAGCGLFKDLREAASWPPGDFRRFAVGRLSDGRDELLECWRRNHLLAPFEELWARREEGSYGGGNLAFLGLDDLIRSKETERDSDWHDVALLEETADLRGIANARDTESRTAVMASLRSRRGFEETGRRGWLLDPSGVDAALGHARHPISFAYLAPASSGANQQTPMASDAIQQVLAGPLRAVTPGSARHLALVEAVRRLYKRDAMDTDRADKEAASRPT